MIVFAIFLYLYALLTLFIVQEKNILVFESEV